MIMNENKETSMNKNEQKRKRGRPRKLRNYILYRSGRKLKGFNTDLGIDMIPTQADITGSVTIYKGLGTDWVAWGRRLTREGYFNTASSIPFRKPEGEIDNVVPELLEEDFRNCKQFRRVLKACTDIFEGRIPYGTVLLTGAYWARVLERIFIEEAGAHGISRTRFEYPVGKIFTSVNVLPTRGSRYNYTLEAWNGVIHMHNPPVFSIKISGENSDTDNIPDGWEPKELAAAILHVLWKHKGGNSCEADASKVQTVAQEPAVTPEAAPLSRCRSCGRVLEFDWASGVCFECVQLAKAEVAANADPSTRRCRVCGAILKGVFADAVCISCSATVNVEECDE
jgi:hypothetical protein